MGTSTVLTACVVNWGSWAPLRYTVGDSSSPEFVLHGIRLISLLNGRVFEIADPENTRIQPNTPFGVVEITDGSLPGSTVGHGVEAGDFIHVGGYTPHRVNGVERDGTNAYLHVDGLDYPLRVGGSEPVAVIRRQATG